MSTYQLCFVLGLAALSAVTHQAVAQGTAFTYHGRLNIGTNAAIGSYDLRFTLFGGASGGSAVAGPFTNSSTDVNNGLFTVTLDFGANFPGADRWLEIGVRTNGVGAFTTLIPRQQITSAPYAITASNVTGTVLASQLSGTVASGQVSGTYSSALTFNNASNSFRGNGSGLTGLNASALASGTVADARLSANVPLLSANQTFTGSNVFSAQLAATNSFLGPGVVVETRTGPTGTTNGIWGNQPLLSDFAYNRFTVDVVAEGYTTNGLNIYNPVTFHGPVWIDANSKPGLVPGTIIAGSGIYTWGGMSICPYADNDLGVPVLGSYGGNFGFYMDVPNGLEMAVSEGQPPQDNIPISIMSLNVPSANLPYANTNFPNGAQAWYITGMGEQVFNSPYQTNMCLNWHVPGKADWNTVTPKADYRSPQIVFQQENLLDPTANVWGPTNYFGIASIQGNLQIGAATNSLQYTNLEVLSHGLLDRVFDYTMIPGKYISIDQQGVLYGNGAGLTNVPDSRYVRSYITAFNPIVNQPVFFTDAPGSSKGMILPPAASWVADLPQWDKFQAAQWTNIVFTCKVYATNNTSTDWHMFLEGPTNTAGASRNQVLQTSDVNRTVVASNWVAFSMTHKPTRYQLTNMQFMQVAIYNNTNKTYWIEGIIVTNAP